MPARAPARAAASLWPVVTLVLWIGCLTVGGLGLTLSYARPHAPQPAAVITQAELLNVQLTSEPLPPLEPPPALPAQPQLEPVPAPAAVPPLLAVAPLNAAVAFALPVTGPAREVAAAHASYVRTDGQTNRMAAAVQPLTFGVGEGRQPAPHYPSVAVRDGQEGKVAVRFSVGENGRVLTAEAAAPSPWPALNEEAVRTVRHRWRFQSGPPRCYEVTIRFELQKDRHQS